MRSTLEVKGNVEVIVYSTIWCRVGCNPKFCLITIVNIFKTGFPLTIQASEGGKQQKSI